MITPKLVQRIRQIAAETDEWGRKKYTAAAIARQLKMNPESIRRIIRRDTWQHVNDDGALFQQEVEVPLIPLTPELSQAADESAKRLLAQLTEEKKDLD